MKILSVTPAHRVILDATDRHLERSLLPCAHSALRPLLSVHVGGVATDND
jgi:hypothetical protein